MKAFGIGLAAVLFITAVASSAFAAGFAIPADARKAGMAATPALVQAAHLPCTVTDAWEFGTHSDPKGKQTFYEVACQDALGYVLVATANNPVPQFEDCIRADEPGPDGKPSNIACRLPGNANPAVGMQSILAGRSCTPAQARYMGSSDTMDAYEVSCQAGTDYVVQLSHQNAAPTVKLCAAMGANNPAHCTLTTQAQQDAQIDSLASAAPKPCQVKGRRYVGSLTDGSADFYEIACADNTGYILQVDNSGKVTQAIDCVQASGLGGGCTLTDTRQAQTEQNAVYSDLARKAGFDCTVSKYADFPARADGAEVVELACSNRPEGGVGFFPPHGAPVVLDCLRTGAEGYECTFTDIQPLFSKLSDQLKAKGKGSCVVSGARPYGMNASGGDLVEVACSDGGPGWVMEYAAGSAAPTELLNCTQAAAMGGGGCQLPTNKSH